MDKKEFSGNLETIDPSLLISKDRKDDYQSFFLILGMIFNDLKGVIFFQKNLEDTYRKTENGEVTVHMGELSGLTTQTNKILISIIVELITFLDLEENKKVIMDPRFLILIKKLDAETRRSWANLVDPKREKGSVVSRFLTIRSNVSSHYDHSLRQLRSGFIKAFFERGNLAHHNSACFSSGSSMETVRFYYADAAVSEYMRSLLDGEDMHTVHKFVAETNLVLQKIIFRYLESLKK